jgi:hypothetical protein
MKQALASRGFIGKGRENTEYNQWIESEKKELASVAKRYGIIWEQKGTHREHLDVLNFKKEQRELEVAALEEQKVQLQEETAICHGLAENLHEELQQTENELQNRKEECANAEKEAEQAKATADKYEKSLKKAKTIAKDIRIYAGEFSKPISEVLPETGMLESAKSYRDKKAFPVISKLKDLLYGLGLSLLRIKIREAAASFLLFWGIKLGKIFNLFNHSTKKAYFNKPFSIACNFILECLNSGTFYWK